MTPPVPHAARAMPGHFLTATWIDRIIPTTRAMQRTGDGRRRDLPKNRQRREASIASDRYLRVTHGLEVVTMGSDRYLRLTHGLEVVMK